MKKVVITTSWDDGHILDLKLAGLLRKYDLPGTFYISPEDREISADKRLKGKDINEIAKDFEIGAHTMTHPRLSTVSDAIAREEITGSKKTLEDVIGRPVNSFCYPGGDYEPKHKAMVREAGFLLARTVARFATEIGGDPFALPTTIHAYRHWSDAAPIFKEAGIMNFADRYSHWDALAIALFEKVAAQGGVFHIWGHSWEIEKNNDWERLERVFSRIAKQENIERRTNGELLHAI